MSRPGEGGECKRCEGGIIVNLVEYVVREIIGEPVFTPYGWMVRCMIEDIGGKREKSIFKGSEEEIREVKIGYKDLH